MKVFCVHLDNDLGYEDHQQAWALVAADDKDKARELVENHGEPLNVKYMPIDYVEVESSLKSDEENSVLTFFLS